MNPQRAARDVGLPDETPSPSTPTSALYREGIVAGVLGAATVALWFLVIDTLAGRPFHTPTVLGTALFDRGAGLESVPSSAQMVFLFTWVHLLAFVVLGGIVSRLLGVAERRPHAGFGILLLFVYLEAAFLVGSFVFARRVLDTLAWPTVMAGNLLAAAVMVAYLWRRHPRLRIPA